MVFKFNGPNWLDFKDFVVDLSEHGCKDGGLHPMASRTGRSKPSYKELTLIYHDLFAISKVLPPTCFR